MAKKRKARVKGKVTVKTIEEKPIAKSVVEAEHLLGLVGGILVIVAAVISAIAMIDIVYAIISLACGVLMLASVYSIKRKPRISAIFLLVLSIIALILPPNGWLVGPILAIIGAIIVLVKSR